MVFFGGGIFSSLKVRMEIYLVTSNENKARLLQGLLGKQVRKIRLDLPEIQAVNVQDVIEHKTRAAFQQVGQPVIVEDTSLAVLAWNGLPGALIRWFLETVGNEGICQMLAGYENREAVAETCIGYDDGREFVSFSGKLIGTIARSPRGDNGFGWDPLFVPEGWTKTLAEMNTEERSLLVSMRQEAVSGLKAYLETAGIRSGLG